MQATLLSESTMSWKADIVQLFAEGSIILEKRASCSMLAT